MSGDPPYDHSGAALLETLVVVLDQLMLSGYECGASAMREAPLPIPCIRSSAVPHWGCRQRFSGHEGSLSVSLHDNKKTNKLVEKE